MLPANIVNYKDNTALDMICSSYVRLIEHAYTQKCRIHYVLVVFSQNYANSVQGAMSKWPNGTCYVLRAIIYKNSHYS